MTLVTKADGTTEDFVPAKLIASLQHAGAAPEDAEQIGKAVEKELYDKIPTNEIYRRAFAHLRDRRREVAARYSLKRAVLEFGPSGFPFEAYIAELFKAEGYEAKIDQIIQGGCAEHEVDAVLTRGDETIYVEAKFHNTAGFKTDLKTALYVKARHEDIAAKRKHDGMNGLMRGLLVTNTKFTTIASHYAECAGVELLAWDYPQGNSLHERIDRAKLYPVTALTSLSKREKMALLQDKLVLCSELPQSRQALDRAGITGKKADIVIEEVGALCVPGKDI